MENSIVNSHISLDKMAYLGNSNISLDANVIVLFILAIALIFLGCAIFAFVNYKRDKDNIPSLHKLERKVDFYSIDFIRINNRLNDLEDKSGNINDLHKSILELKSLIMRSKNGK